MNGPTSYQEGPSTPLPAKIRPASFPNPDPRNLEPWRSFCRRRRRRHRRRRTRTPSLTRVRRPWASWLSAATSPRRCTPPPPRPPSQPPAHSLRPPPRSRSSPSPSATRSSPPSPRRLNSPVEAPVRLVTARFVMPTLLPFSRLEFDGK